jgi:hypothetical protein
MELAITLSGLHIAFIAMSLRPGFGSFLELVVVKTPVTSAVYE